MQWREKLALLLGAATPFSVGNGADAAALHTIWLDSPQPPEVNKDQLLFVDPAQRNRLIQLASHSSHSSQSSHSSHVSGYGGHASHYSGSTVPAYSPPVYSPPPAPTPSPGPAPRPQGLYGSPGSTDGSSASAVTTTEAKKFTKDELSDFIQKVQIALITRGYDPGPVDGVYSEKMKQALGQFQSANGLKVTNLMDLKTLRQLNVVQ